jgi:hypothetical protein
MLDANEQEYWVFIFAFAALVFAVYPMIKDYMENREKTERAMKRTVLYSLALMAIAQLLYKLIFKN